MYGPGLICVEAHYPAEATIAPKLEIEVKLRRLDEMRAQYTLQQLRVHILVEDVHVSQSVTAEAGPCTDFGWMRILVHAILRIQRLTLRPTNEYLTPEALTPENLLVGELDTHPVRRGPILVSLSE